MLENYSGWEKETVVAPFTKVSDVQKNMRRRSDRGTPYDVYTVTLEAAELEQLSPEDRDALFQRVTDDAPRIYDLISQLVRSNDAREDIIFKRDRHSKNILEFMKEKAPHEKTLAELRVLSEEQKLIDLMDLWRSAVQITGGVHGENKSLADIESRLREYGFEATEYSSELESQFMTTITGTMMGLDMFWSEEERSVNQRINSNFSRVKLETGISKEDMIEELSVGLIDYVHHNYDVDPEVLVNLLSRGCSYFENHMELCGIDGRDDLEEKVERTEGKLNSIYKEIYSLRGEIATREKELREHDENIEAIKPEVRKWKSDVARLCMSDCRSAELTLDEQMRAVEMQREAEKAAALAEEEKRKKVVAEEQVKMEQQTVDETREIEAIESNESVNKENNEQKREQIIHTARVLDGRFDANNMIFNQDSRQSFDSVSRRCKRIAADIQSVSGNRYSSQICEYENAMRNARDSIGRVANIGVRNIESDGALVALQQIAHSNIGITDPRLSGEVLNIQGVEENLLKKVVFEKFCKIAIGAETASLTAEATSIRTADSKRGLSRLFGGPSKQDLERCEQIERIVENATHQADKPFAGKTYSYREIMSDMMAFTEQHREDAEYGRAIQEVENLQNVLNSHFGVRNPNVIRELKEQKVREQQASGMDPRVYRINQLRNSMEKTGICYRTQSRVSLDSIKQVGRFAHEKIRELGETRDNRDRNTGGEISQ